MRGHRRQVVRPPSARGLVLITGLPRATSGGVANWVAQNIGPDNKVIAMSSPDRDGVPLYTLNYITSCVLTVTDYAERQSELSAGESAPSSITLAYVPDDSVENLLSMFDFSVFPIGLWGLEKYENGRQLRQDDCFSRETILHYLRESSASFGPLKRRLSSYSSRDAIFLPPENFQLTRSRQLKSLFLEMRTGERPWDDGLEEAATVKATREELPHHVPQGSRDIFRDHRELWFPKDQTDHGRLRTLEQNSETRQRMGLLRSSYRFGVPLPNGFHHDAQLAGDSPLSGMSFMCTEKGEIRPSCDYVNIYPDDFVRPSSK
jgi:hypothetical protein